MYHFIKKNQRKMLAIFAAGLMVVFILPTTMKGTGRQSRGDIVRGRFGASGEELRASDIQRGRDDVELLGRQLTSRSMRGMPPIYLLAPIDEVQEMMFARQLGQPAREPEIVQQLVQHPEMFALLLKEAEQMGVTISNDRLGTVLQNDITIPATLDEDQQAACRRAVFDLLTIQAAFDRVSGNVMVSEPMRRQAQAGFAQNITLELVEFPAKDFESKVPAPTTQQVNEQFNKFSNQLPDTGDVKANPFGFGYRYPNRVKLQYIEVNRDDVRESIKPTKSTSDEEYAWDVRARRFYMANSKLYPTTQATQAAAEKAKQPKGAPFSLEPTSAPTTGPTTKPYAEVKQEIIDRLVREETDKKATEIQNKINARLAGDYLAYQQSTSADEGAGTNATTQRAAPTPYGFPFTSYEYLQALASDIQKQTNVLPRTTNLGDEFRSAKELEDVPGIGKARAAQISFPDYAIQLAFDFVPPQYRKSPNLLHTYEPSRMLTDDSDDTFIFRLTETQPSHVPLGPSEVLAQVQADVRARESLDQAKAAAQSMLDAAKASSLSAAADVKSKKLITAGPFRGLGARDIPGYSLAGVSEHMFFEDAVDLLNSVSPSNPHPMRLIELPRDGKVLVAQLKSVEPTWKKDAEYSDQIQIAQQLREEMSRGLQSEWFNYDNVVTRLKYHPVEQPGEGKPTETAGGNPLPPQGSDEALPPFGRP